MLRAAIAVGILLSVVCGASAQSPVVTIQSTGFQGNTFYIDVALADAGALAGQKLGGIGRVGLGCLASAASVLGRSQAVSAAEM